MTFSNNIKMNWVYKLLKDHLCQDCNRIFTSTSNLQRHRITYCRSHFVFPCCNEPFDWSSNLTQHECFQIVEREKLSNHFNSQIRSLSPVSSVSHEKKVQESVGVKNLYTCNNCPATFMRYHSIKKHILKFPNKHNFTCNDCQKFFTTEHALNKHLCFLGNGSFKCSCSQIFNNLKTFKEHAGSRRPYFCCTCQKKNASLNNLVNHIRSHTKENPFSCSICKKTFRVRESLALHKRLHDGKKPFRCSKCNYLTATKWNLLLHEKIHSADRELERRFVCALCGNKFFLKHHLKRHIAIHTEGKTHLCLVCGKLFNQSSYLDKHLVKHSREAESGQKCGTCGKVLLKMELYQHHLETHHFQFVCDPCGKVFLNKFNLERHRKSHNEIGKLI